MATDRDSDAAPLPNRRAALDDDLHPSASESEGARTPLLRDDSDPRPAPRDYRSSSSSSSPSSSPAASHPDSPRGAAAISSPLIPPAGPGFDVDVDGDQDYDGDGDLRSRKCCAAFLRRCRDAVLTVICDDSGDPRRVATGLVTVAVVGIALGLALPKNEDLNGTAVQYLSSCIGYTYFMAWSVSFYPQVFLNYRRKDTAGLSVDFCFLNLFGFMCYGTFNAVLFWSVSVQKMYADRHAGSASLVEPNDVAFAIHAVALATVWIIQIKVYTPERIVPSRGTIVILSAMASASLFYALLVVAAGGDDGGTQQPADESIGLGRRLNWLDFLYTLADFKVAITIFKYVPQVVLNWRRGSTVGWNIWNVLLDFTGGMLSTVQLLLDSWNTNDWGGITGDPAKFALGFVSILFDLIFFVQHYLLYPDKEGVISVIGSDGTDEKLTAAAENGDIDMDMTGLSLHETQPQRDGDESGDDANPRRCGQVC